MLADLIDSIADEGNRLHTLTVLHGAQIVLSDQGDDEWQSAPTGIHVRRGGRIRTTYTGTRDLPVAAVLDLGERLADEHLTA